MTAARLLYQLRFWMRSLTRHQQADRELDEEMQFHIEELAARGTARGLSPERARAEALRAMDGVDRHKEACRDMRRTHFLIDFARDLRYAWRSLARVPAFFALAVASLALGIGANSAIFTLIDSVLLRPLSGAPNASRLVRLTNPSFSFPQFEALRARQVFASTAAVSRDELPVIANGAAWKANLAMVSGEYFEALGVQPFLGRVISPEDERQQSAVVVLDYSYWRTRFAADPAAVGAHLRIGEVDATVIGVTPEDFRGVFTGRHTDLTLPITARPKLRPERADILTARMTSWLLIFGAQRPDEGFEQTRAKFEPAWNDAIAISPRPKEHRSTTIEPAINGFSPLHRNFGSPLQILMGLVAMLLAAACVNLASLLIARNGARHHELAIRRSLGARRGRLVRQLLAESFLLAGLASLAGIALAYGGARFLAASMSTPSFPIDLDLRPNLRILGFTAAAALLSVLLFGLAPAWRGSFTNLVAGMKAGGRGSFGGGRLRKVLVVVQIAFAMVLAAGAGLLLASLRNVLAVELGFTPARVILVRAAAIEAGHRGPRAAAFYTQLRDRALSIPGVESAGLAWAPPASQGFGSSGPIAAEGFDPPAEGRLAWSNVVTPGYLETIGQPLLAGRMFSNLDRKGSPRVAIVNQTMAKRFFPGANPLGRRFSTSETGPFDCEVVGVVRDSVHFDQKEDPKTVYYVPYEQRRSWIDRTNLYLAVRTSLPVEAASAEIGRLLHGMDARVTATIESLAGHVAASRSREVILAQVSAFLGFLSLILGGLGIYGVMSWSVTRRRAEIGVRVALGAPPRSVLVMVAREGLLLAAFGIVTGAVLSLSLANLLQALLFGVTPKDAAILAGAVSATAVIAALATLIPAIRAARIDPLQALRQE